MPAMNHPRFFQVAAPVPLPRLFDYLGPQSGPEPRPGCRVLVPFGKRKLVAVVVSVSDRSEVEPLKLQAIEQVLDEGEALLDEELLNLLTWCWKYYKHAPGEIISAALPPALRKAQGRLPEAPLEYRLSQSGEERIEQGPGRARTQFEMLQAMADGPVSDQALSGIGSQWRATLRRLVDQGWVETAEAGGPVPQLATGPQLTGDQQNAVEAIVPELGDFSAHLLDGVTGSGKTEVYLRLIEHVLESKKQVLVLVPEIGLTPQLLRRFEQRLGFSPAIIHSAVAAGERLRAWQDARTGRAPVLIGTRAALFTPLPRLGLIVLDEEHDASFKQQDGFRYSARDLAVKRAADLEIPVILGSATPSLESYRNALAGRYRWHRLRERATRASLPSWRVLDLRQQSAIQGLTSSALEALEETLERGEQAMVFLNRRGFAPVLMCQECSWHGQCDRCDANLTWHRSAGRLCCHHCGSRRPVPRFCPECRADALVGAGEGTQQLEDLLIRRFPEVPVLRFDRDQTARKGVMHQQIETVREGEPCLLIGTQMLAKGHHFPAVTLVVIVNIDQALYSADYRALERMGQMIQQVAGRAGRAEKPGTVILQTLHPEHEAIELLLTRGYEEYARWLLNDRQLAGLPPVTAQALLRAEAHQRSEAEDFLKEAFALFPDGTATVFGPMPAIMERHSGRSRLYLVLMAEQRSDLHRQLDAWLPAVQKLPSARRVRWHIDVDPQEL